MEENIKRWNKPLQEALWACQNYPTKANGCILFRLTNVHATVLPLEINVMFQGSKAEYAKFG